VSTKSETLVKALEARGHTGITVWWEPVTHAMEMCGPGGGWMATTDQRDHEPLGLCYEDAIDHIADAPWMRVTG
jgi:hypothetical protein